REGPEPGPSLVSPAWRELLEHAEPGPRASYHLGVAQWHAGDRSQAVRSWEHALRQGMGWPARRALAAADVERGHPERAADRYARAVAEADEAGASRDARTALALEAIPALLAVGRAEEAAAVLAAVHPVARARGRFRLLEARVLEARGDDAAARAVLAEGFEVEDLGEGEAFR
ncbi:DUF5107 domain-containing protein, partial [Streptomyces sp. UNOB3_S3]|nr:DUF5107 domain-containing protein [Streptomyces sp. UNOB3_S3]